MSMTRQHFRDIAEAVASLEGRNLRARVCDALIPVMKKYNARFSPGIFREACMGERAEDEEDDFVMPITLTEWNTTPIEDFFRKLRVK